MRVAFFNQIRSIALLLLIPLWGCSEPSDPAGKPRQRAAHLVEVETAIREPLILNVDRTGTLRVSREVRILNQVDGRLEQVIPFEGDIVKRGTTLIRLESNLLQAELAKARAERKQEELSLNRLRKLNQQRLASEDEIARARTAVEVAAAEETLLKTRLGYAQIKAPFDGVITERLMEPGDVAPRHSHILTLIDPASMFTQVAVSELLLPALKVGDPVTIRIDALGDRVYSGRIQRIHPTVNSRTRLGQVEVALESVPAGAHAGQLSRVRLTGTATARLAISFNAVRRGIQGTYVFVVDAQDKVDKREVRTGLRVAEKIEILEGLTKGDQVVTKGFLGIAHGKKVKVVNRSYPPEVEAEVEAEVKAAVKAAVKAE